MKPLHAIKLFFLLAGFVVLFYLFRSLGIEKVMGQIYQMGWGLAVILCFPIIIQHVLFVFGWQLSFSGKAFRFWELFQVNLLGEAFNYITPSGQMGGEPLKAMSLRKELGGVQALSSVVAAKTGKTVSMAVFVLLGVLFTIPNFNLSPELTKAVMSSLAVFVLLCLTLFFVQQKGLFGSVTRLLEKVPFLSSRIKEKIGHFDLVDQGLKGFYRGQKGKFFMAMFVYGCGWMIGAVEIYLILYLLGIPVTWSAALAIEALSIIITAVFFFVPGGLGIQEGGKVFIFQLLGMDPAAGMALGLVRRLRELTWVALGLVIFAYRPMKGKEQPGMGMETSVVG